MLACHEKQNSKEEKKMNELERIERWKTSILSKSFLVSFVGLSSQTESPVIDGIDGTNP